MHSPRPSMILSYRECDRYRVGLLPDSRSVHLMQALAPVIGGSPRRRYHYLDNAWSWLWSFMSEHVRHTNATTRRKQSTGCN